MYALIERLAILHISKFICTLEKEKKDVAIAESGPKKNFRVNGFTKTVTPHLRSIVLHVQRHMAYFASSSNFTTLRSRPGAVQFTLNGVN
jgi:hypothetical protein